MTPPPVLHAGNCERLKATTHALAMGIAAVCAAYNAAAWIVRRQRHLAFNAVLYTAATVWEAGHVRHHLEACPAPQVEPVRQEELPRAS